MEGSDQNHDQDHQEHLVMLRAEVAGGGGDELNGSCCSTVERRREEGGAAQRRWQIIITLDFPGIVLIFPLLLLFIVFDHQPWLDSGWTV